MADQSALIKANAERWENAKLTRNFLAIAKSLCAAKTRYQAVEAKTGVPWFIIAVIHEREASQRWDTQLGQGDPLNQVSVHVPAGRGPFNTWEDGAIDALVNCGPYASRWTDWSTGGALALLEQYNGLGYFLRGVPSPYIWAGTDQYTSGKYVKDGVYDPDTIDKQPGCAGLIKTMMVLDRSITFGSAKPSPTPTPAPPKPVPAPDPAPKPSGSLLDAIISFILSIFKRS
jgi:lysozyme family protein